MSTNNNHNGSDRFTDVADIVQRIVNMEVEVPGAVNTILRRNHATASTAPNPSTFDDDDDDALIEEAVRTLASTPIVDDHSRVDILDALWERFEHHMPFERLFPGPHARRAPAGDSLPTTRLLPKETWQEEIFQFLIDDAKYDPSIFATLLSMDTVHPSLSRDYFQLLLRQDSPTLNMPMAARMIRDVIGSRHLDLYSTLARTLWRSDNWARYTTQSYLGQVAEFVFAVVEGRYGSKWSVSRGTWGAPELPLLVRTNMTYLLCRCLLTPTSTYRAIYPSIGLVDDTTHSMLHSMIDHAIYPMMRTRDERAAFGTTGLVPGHTLSSYDQMGVTAERLGLTTRDTSLKDWVPFMHRPGNMSDATMRGMIDMHWRRIHWGRAGASVRELTVTSDDVDWLARFPAVADIEWNIEYIAQTAVKLVRYLSPRDMRQVYMASGFDQAVAHLTRLVHIMAQHFQDNPGPGTRDLVKDVLFYILGMLPALATMHNGSWERAYAFLKTMRVEIGHIVPPSNYVLHFSTQPTTNPLDWHDCPFLNELVWRSMASPTNPGFSIEAFAPIQRKWRFVEDNDNQRDWGEFEATRLLWTVFAAEAPKYSQLGRLPDAVLARLSAPERAYFQRPLAEQSLTSHDSMPLYMAVRTLMFHTVGSEQPMSSPTAIRFLRDLDAAVLKLGGPLAEDHIPFAQYDEHGVPEVLAPFA